MKKSLGILLFLLVNLVFATSINYAFFLAHYKVGDEVGTHRWYINNSGVNEFSNTLFATIDPSTQILIQSQNIMIGTDENDSVITFVYNYRYYKKNESPSVWKPVDILFQNYSNPYPGAFYTSWQISNFPFLDLPIDTGQYILELEIATTVVGVDGDTLTKYYTCPDGQELKNYFNVVVMEEASTALELDNFQANVFDHDVLLSWQTLSECENSHFILYRNDEYITYIQAAGTSTEKHDYDYCDPCVPSGNYTYVLSDVDFTGNETVCASQQIRIPEKNVEDNLSLRIYPNPFNPRITLSIEYGVGSDAVVRIYNTNGVLLEELFNGHLEAGTHQIVWDASNMTSAVYIVKMIAGNVTSTQKLVLMK